MRKIININNDWIFSKEKIKYDNIVIPHTWNNIDGTDGGNDYYRGKCLYIKNFSIDYNSNEEVYIEFNGVNQRCEAYLNNKLIGKHLGGYSIFRFNITAYLEKENKLEVYVSNEISGDVYPQQADFTFYGGIYRDVNLIIVPKSHFDLDYFGSNGLKVTPILKNNMAFVNVEAYFTSSNGMKCKLSIGDLEKEVLIENNYCSYEFIIENPHLWDGINDPYLYLAKASIDGDLVSSRFGIREFRMDPNQGFFLNGRNYKLHGVSRHQDRENKGYAISKLDHEEDLKIIMEMGANAVRLAHYQHDQYFYDLCDEKGIICWAEIPYISEHLANGKANTISQMNELVIENYNHPSIICWGLSNEICISNSNNPSRLENHIELNNLCHSLDKTRPTVMAHIGSFDVDNNPLFKIPDIHGINIYYGWYEKNVEDCKDYFDIRHKNHSDACFSISEYGADCNPKYCGLNPERGDYTENYQCYYHEQMLDIIEARPYLWASFVWNMFDFGADGRSEGGNQGKNQKGLVTFDRRYRKDAYYLYKCHWNSEKMVHICNKHYFDRTEKKTRVVVYSNSNEVSLYKDDILIETKNGMYKYIFEFEIDGVHNIKAVANGLEDSTIIRLASVENKEYHLDNHSIINWLGFIDKERKGYFTLESRVYEILKNEEAKNYLLSSLNAYGVTMEYLTKDNPRSPGSTLEEIPIKFVLRMCKGLSVDDFNSFAEGLMKIKK